MRAWILDAYTDLKGTELNMLPTVIKGIVHPKMFMSLFTHSHVVPNLYSFLSCAEHKRRYFEECGNQTVAGPH